MKPSHWAIVLLAGGFGAYFLALGASIVMDLQKCWRNGWNDLFLTGIGLLMLLICVEAVAGGIIWFTITELP